MSRFGDGKVLLCLAVWLAVSSASSLGQQKTGYDYKPSSSSAGLNRILKAILVHESTGHGLHSGSISGDNEGNRITVMKQEPLRMQPSVGYSYGGGQQMQGYQQQRGMKNIRVFHKSLGDTGNIRPQGYGASQAQVAKMSQHYSQQQRQGSYNAIKREFTSGGITAQGGNSGQSLRYIHETALSKPSVFLPTVVPPEEQRSGYNYASSQQNPSNGYQYSQPATQGFQFLQNQGPQLQPAPPQMSFSTNFRPESPPTSGYPYPTPAPTQTGVAEQIAISHYFSSAIQPATQGYRYDKPQQELGNGPQLAGPSNSNGYQYPNPESPAQSESAGYHYDRPQKSFEYEKPAVTKSTFKGQSYLPMPSANSGNSYDSQQNNGYTYEKPSERPKMVFKGPSYLPLPPASGDW